MFNQKLKYLIEQQEDQLADYKSFIQSIKNSVPCIEFSPDGIILEANTLFFDMVGCTPSDIVNQHHKVMCPQHVKDSLDYQRFWHDLKNGKLKRGTFERKRGNGAPLYLEATYFPIIHHNHVVRIMKIASDVTETCLAAKREQAILSALDRAVAVIEFSPDGTVHSANENFLKAMGYQAHEVVGQHHRIFCHQEFYQENPDFWKQLTGGILKQGQFRRRTKSGDTLWLEATYNPIVDDDGKIRRIIKFATDITHKINQNNAIAAAAAVARNTALSSVESADEGIKLLNATSTLCQQLATHISEASENTKSLDSKSRHIEEITSTIKGVSEQTNLLALNAAIEAARAGEQGRGFAVVADEVRELASRTASSSIEIEKMVTENRIITENVSRSIDTVLESFQQSVEQISDACSAMSDINNGAINVAETVDALTLGEST